MKKITVDLTNIETPGGMHAYLAYMMNFPAYYGRNFDALHDMLTEIGEDTLLMIRRPAKLPEAMEKIFPVLGRVLLIAQEENGHFRSFVEITE
ncbi:MAG: barstar family protein [Clostridia bacterium]|nr:barstar family protein [Clostridia bacterium]